MNSDKIIRDRLVMLLNGREAHMTFEDAVADFPEKFFNKKPPHIDYTPWHILEHIRITQKDILDFITKGKAYKEIKWPNDYWPKKSARADKKMWLSTISQFQKDNEQLQKIVMNKKTDLTALLSWGEPYTILREVHVVTDHNAYHIGEFAILRQVMGTWPKNHK